MVKLILITPDIFAGGVPVEKIITLSSSDFAGKTIKQVFAENAFREALQGQDQTSANQALQLIFTIIRPKDISDIASWWELPFESLLNNSEDVTLNMEISETGLEFLNQVM